MNTIDKPTAEHHQPGRYAIRIQGHLDDHWAGWFEGMTLIREVNGETLITGMVADQAALHGLLRKVRDLGMPLISVYRFGTRPDEDQAIDDAGR